MTRRVDEQLLGLLSEMVAALRDPELEVLERLTREATGLIGAVARRPSCRSRCRSRRAR